MRKERKGRARGRVNQKGDGGDSGGMGTLAAGLLGAVAEAAEAWRRWQGKVRFLRVLDLDSGGWRRGRSLEKEGKNAEDEKKRVKGTKRVVVRKRKKTQNKKERRDQRGLGPRLRVARRAVGAKARFRAQRAIPRYTSRGVQI
jgi:hypothetical protein